MELFKRKDGRSPYWQVDFVHPVTGQRTRASLKPATTKGAAEKAARALMQRLEDAAREATGGRRAVSLGVALGGYVEALQGASKASSEGVRRLVEKTLGGIPGRWSLPGEMPLEQLTPAHMAALVKARRAEGNGPQTIAHEIKVIRAATRHAYAEGFKAPEAMLNGSIRDAWKIPPVPVKTRYLTLEEFQRVYDWLDPDRPVQGSRGGKPTAAYRLTGEQRQARQDARDLLVALAMCGGRWSEVKSLRWDRIDLEALDQWWNWENSYGGDPAGRPPRPVVTLRLWGNKTQRERLVGLPDMACQVLLRRLQAAKTQGGLVFPNSDGRARGATCKAILRALNDCGLNTPEKVAESGKATVHSLRHTFASLLLQNGASLADIQDALGHTTMNMTRRYAHLAKVESAAKLAGILSEAVKCPPMRGDKR